MHRRKRSRPSRRSAQRPTICLEQIGHTVWISPPVAELETVFVSRTIAPFTSAGYASLPLIGRVEEAGIEQQVVSAGLLRPIAQFLRARGRRFQIVSSVESIRPWPAPPSPLPLEGDAEANRLIRFIHEHERGLLRIVSPRVEVAPLVAAVARAWPDAPMAIAASTLKEVRRLGRQLRQCLSGEPVDVLNGSVRPNERARLCVGTWTALALAFSNQRLIIALDAVEATGVQPAEILRRAANARLFGVIREGRSSSRLDLDLVRGLFGFDEFELLGDGRVRRPIRVVTERIQANSVAAPSILQLKRQGVWRHPVRNRRVVNLAKGIVEGDLTRLRRTRRIGAALRARPQRVAVLVENLEHARHLAEQLPGWPVLHGDLPTGERFRETADPTPGVIVTAAGWKHCDLATVDVLVRADAGAGGEPLLASDFFVIANTRAARPLLLIDFDDRHHRELWRRSQQRRDAYLAAGFEVAGRERDPVAEFLANRPGVRQ